MSAPQPQEQYTPPPGSYPGKGMSIAALVLGIVAIVGGFIIPIPFIDLACAIVALILGVLGRKKAKEVGAPSGIATAGLVLSIIALAWTIIATIICLCVIGAVAGGLVL